MNARAVEVVVDKANISEPSRSFFPKKEVAVKSHRTPIAKISKKALGIKEE